MLIGEERNIESKTASFFCALPSGLLWKRRNFGEQWWTGIEAVHRGVLFLYGFATPDLPGRRGITAVDCARGEILWQNGTLTFLAAAGENVYSLQDAPAGPLVLEIDHRTGAFVREVGRGESALLRVPRSEEPFGDAGYPQVLSVGDDSPLSGLVRKLSAGAVKECPVEYGEDGRFVVIVYHAENPAAGADRAPYRRVMDIVERETEQLALRITLDAAVVTPAFGAFLAQDGMLYFVRERKTLSAVRLREKELI
jgi:hypothetical protein